MTDGEGCGVLALKDDFIAMLEVEPIPDDYTLESRNLFSVQAQIRHELTNYEYLLKNMNFELCHTHCENGGRCTYDDDLDPWVGCASLSTVYWELKVRAIDMAQAAYDEWKKRHRPEP